MAYDKGIVVRRHRLSVLLASLALVMTGSGTAAADDEPTPGPTPGQTTGQTTGPASNQAPTALDDAASTEPGKSITVDVLVNDTDDGAGRAQGTPAYLDVVGASGGTGTLSFDATSITYLPAAAEYGDVHLTYQVSDGDLEATGNVVIHIAGGEPTRTVGIQLAKRLVGLRSYRIRGVVTPAPARVLVETREATRRWTALGTVRVGAQGRYSLRYTPNRVGRVSFRAVVRSPDSPTTSPTITRRVIARPAVHVSRPLVRSRVRYSWRPGCPVPPKRLREITINRFDYGKTLRRGSLVVNADAVPDVVTVMRAAFDKQFPIRRMRPADHYYDHGRRTPSGSDLAAMSDDNTSAFNCRPVTGNPYRISQHSYGNAIDINTVRNPYVTGSRVYPSWAHRYLDRSRYRAGMILSGGVVAARMRSVGWLWGARWGSPDYQHFSSNGG